jgi:EAL domain-containing protein (putative c-di-GMP-specific phosphodiesterase class I)
MCNGDGAGASDGIMPPLRTGETVVEGGRILVVDDDQTLLRVYTQVLRDAGHRVDAVADGKTALEHFGRHRCDAVVSDVAMPGLNGLQLLQAIRQHDLDVPVILITGDPSLDTASKAVELGAFRYLPKPLAFDAFKSVINTAVAFCRTARLRRQVLTEAGKNTQEGIERAALAARFENAIGQIWVAYQPIVRWSTQQVFAYEALARSHDVSMPDPSGLLEAAEKLGQMRRLGRSLRAAAAQPMTRTEALLFVNLAPRDFEDDELFAPESPLARIAGRAVLEVTERASLDEIRDFRGRVDALRRLGYRIALDDVGAGYSGLNSFALLEPDVVKLDMSLVRGLHVSETKQKLIRSMISLCEGLDTIIVAEGVESVEEWRALADLGCDYFQGFLFARPALPFPTVTWGPVSAMATSARILRAGAS